MKLYICEAFKGHYPVGKVALVKANTPEQAAVILEIELGNHGLPQEIDEETMEEVVMDEIGLAFILDGNY